MEISRELLFFFSALGAFNGLVLSFYFLFFAKPNHISNKFLGLFLLMLSIRVGKSVFFYFNPDLSYYYLQFGLTACFFIGPFLYFYIKSVLKYKENIFSSLKYHLLILIPLAFIFGYLYPFNSYHKLWVTVINIIYIQWFLYIVATALVMQPIFKRCIDKTQKLSSLDFWLLSVFIGTICIWAAYTFTSITYYLVGALTFSFLLYLLGLALFFNKKKQSIFYNENQKYGDKKIEEKQANTLIKKLDSLMLEEELFKNANLKSFEVAKKLNITTHQFSQLLNDNLGKNFASFVNQYRINEAKNMLIKDSNLTLEAIGYECGFNSESTFYTSFKKNIGKTPSQFKSSNL